MKRLSTIASILITLAIAWVILDVVNLDYLFAVQERNLWMNGWEFFNDCVRVPGGMVRWCGMYLTQMFYYPWLGTLFLSLIWIACWGLLSKLFNFKGYWNVLLMLPIVAMVTSEVDLGYLLYNFKPYGYWFTQPLGFTIACSVALFFSNARFKLATLCIYGLILYPILGWWFTLAMILFALSDRINEEAYIITKDGVAALLLALITPILWKNVIDFPIHKYDTWSIGGNFSCSWICVYCLVLLLAVVIPFVQNRISLKSIGQWALLFVLSICSISYAWFFSYHDKNYSSEIRMYRYAENSNWQAIIHEAKTSSEHPTEQMMILRELALLNLGHLEQSFNYDCTTQPQTLNKGLESGLIQSGAPLVYLLHGRPNFATQWCIESATQTGMNITFLQILARCAKMKGEEDLANKYLTMIHKTTFYHDWQIPSTTAIERDLYDNGLELLDGDNGQCMQYLFFSFANNPNYRNNKISVELGLVYSIMIRDNKAFAHRFSQYRQNHPLDIPAAYQQAAQTLLQ